jgi:hypothetical protein
MVPGTNVGRPNPRPHTFREWCVLVCRRTVVLRGLKFAVVVGAILIAINHGDAILRGDLDPVSYTKMALTVVVPYVVSVFSSVGAIIEQGGYRPRESDEEVARAS